MGIEDVSRYGNVAEHNRVRIVQWVAYENLIAVKIYRLFE